MDVRSSFSSPSPLPALCPRLEACYQMTELEEDCWQRTRPPGSLAWEVSCLLLKGTDRNLAGRSFQIKWLVSSADLPFEIAPNQRTKLFSTECEWLLTSHVSICLKHLLYLPLRFEAHLPEMTMRLVGRFKCSTCCDFVHIFSVFETRLPVLLRLARFDYSWKLRKEGGRRGSLWN